MPPSAEAPGVPSTHGSSRGCSTTPRAKRSRRVLLGPISSTKMTSYGRRSVKQLLRTNGCTVSRSRLDTAGRRWTRRVANLHVSLTKRRGRFQAPSLICAAADSEWLEPVPHKTYFYIFKSCVERAIGALRSQKERSGRFGQAKTSATDGGSPFCRTVQATSFPYNPNIAASASRAL